MHAPADLADIVTDILARIRDRAPRVHCITNNVAQHYTASMLLAAGAVPSMTIAAEEVGADVGKVGVLQRLGHSRRRRRADGVLRSLGLGDGGPQYKEQCCGKCSHPSNLYQRTSNDIGPGWGSEIVTLVCRFERQKAGKKVPGGG